MAPISLARSPGAFFIEAVHLAIWAEVGLLTHMASQVPSGAQRTIFVLAAKTSSS